MSEQELLRTEEIGNELQLICWNLVSESIKCSGKMCNKGKGSNRLCAGLKPHRDKILAKVKQHYEQKGRLKCPVKDKKHQMR